VVSLDSPERKLAIPPILQNVRSAAKRRLNDLLQELLNNADDALFEMANRSRNDTDENMFFEAMREIRLQRKKISKHFVDEFHRSFDDIFAAEEPTPRGPIDESPDELSLLRNDELEVAVAVSGMVSKITSQFSLPIMQLTKRLDHACESQTITERVNPLGPERISRAFVRAIEAINLDIKLRIIILKLFERFVMEQLGPTYEEANKLLAEAGVLRDLSAMRGRASGGPGHGQSGAAATDHAGAHGDAGSSPVGGGGGSANFGIIQTLLSRFTGDRSGVPIAATSGKTIETSQLLSMLSDVQGDRTVHSIDPASVPESLDLQAVLAARSAQVLGHVNASPARDDGDAMNFVAMLFDYILNDRNLAIPMKALIARLQIPIIRLAIIDKSFFEKSNHPARQLLNELSSAGIGWSAASELKRDALYNFIESIVLRVLNDFADNPDLFETLVEELREFLKKDLKRRLLMEKRVKEIETGKAKTKAAKETVQNLINEMASGQRVPPEIGKFISETWSKALIFACVTAGTESDLWNHHVRVMADLLKIIQPLQSEDDIAARDAVAPDLIDTIEAALVDLKIADRERNDLITMLTEQLRQLSADDRAHVDEPESAAPVLAFETMRNVTLTAPTEAEEQDPDDPPPPQYVDEVNRLEEGAWLEFVDEHGDNVRVKLAGIIEPGARYVFTNRRGIRVFKKSKMQLANDLQNQTVMVLDESQVFDRALQAVISKLRTEEAEE
jgi:hypothetical protein